MTGHHGDARHLGNIFSDALADGRAAFDRDTGANVSELSRFFDTSDYLTATSDIVALLVLEHQVSMHNRLIEGDFTVRSALYRSRQLNKELGVANPDEISDSCRRIISNQADNILECLLFRDEAALPYGGIESKGPFMAEFAGQGKKNREGRSLRDFQLLDRIFKYRCSYMIHSLTFEHLSPPLKQRVLARLAAVLDGADTSGRHDHLGASERRHIRAILGDLLPPPVEG